MHCIHWVFLDPTPQSLGAMLQSLDPILPLLAVTHYIHWVFLDPTLLFLDAILLFLDQILL
jgi:hypothetical protein